VCRTRFSNDLHQGTYAHSQKLGKPNNFKTLRVSKPVPKQDGQNRIRSNIYKIFVIGNVSTM
jgi:hypothetical protein